MRQIVSWFNSWASIFLAVSVLAYSGFIFPPVLCSGRANLLSVHATKDILVGFMPARFLGVSGCPETAYLDVRSNILHQNYVVALDRWTESSLKGTGREPLLPNFFRELVNARSFSTDQHWNDAVKSYREAFALIVAGGIDSIEMQIGELMPEYETSLIEMYRNQQNTFPVDVFRQAVRLWRNNQIDSAIQTLKESTFDDEGEYYTKRLTALQYFLEAEKLSEEGRKDEAVGRLSMISSEQRDFYLRALLDLVELQSSDTNHLVNAELSSWSPSIPLDFWIDDKGTKLTGVEIMEPEMTQDGGWVYLALFLDGLSSGIPANAVSWRINDHQSVQIVKLFNQISDPGFEAGNEALNQDWLLELTSQAEARTMTLSRNGIATSMLCLRNGPQFSRLNIVQDFQPTQPNQLYFSSALLQNGQDSKSATFWKRWLFLDREQQFTWLTSREQSNGWSMYADVERAKVGSIGAVIGLQNLDAGREVCFDNVLFGRIWPELGGRP